MPKSSTPSREPLSVWEFPKLATSVHEFRKAKTPSAKIRNHFAAILAFVYRNRLARADQVQRRFARFLKSDRTTRRHLAEMQSLGFLETQPVNSISPLLPKIYFVTAKGRRHLKAAFAKQGKNWEESTHDRRRTEGQSFVHVWHEISITEFLLSVWETARAHPDWKLSALERRSLFKHPAFELNRSGHHRVVPDGQFLIHHPKGKILSFLEIDTGTESPRQLTKKLESYQIWADSPAGKDYLCELYSRAGASHPRPNFRLLFVIAPQVIGLEETRLQTFRQLIGQPKSLQKRLWFTSSIQLRTIKPPQLLTAPIWFRGGISLDGSPCSEFFSC